MTYGAWKKIIFYLIILVGRNQINSAYNNISKLNVMVGDAEVFNTNQVLSTILITNRIGEKAPNRIEKYNLIKNHVALNTKMKLNTQQILFSLDNNTWYNTDQSLKW